MKREALWQLLLQRNPAMQAQSVHMSVPNLRKLVNLVWDKAQEDVASRMNGAPTGGDVPDFLKGLFNGS